MNTTSAFCKNSRAWSAAPSSFVMHSSRVAAESEPCASQQCHGAPQRSALNPVPLGFSVKLSVQSDRMSWKTSGPPNFLPFAIALICIAIESGLYTVPKGLVRTLNLRAANCAETLSAKHDPKKATCEITVEKYRKMCYNLVVMDFC